MIGHAAIRLLLERGLPPVTLFLGPPSVGKWTLAEHLRRHHGYHDDEVLRVRRIDVAAARQIRDTVVRASFGVGRLVIASLDGITAPSAHVLLKTLEELPETARVILVADGPVLDTVVTRAQVFAFDLLTDAEVEQVLTTGYFTPGIRPEEARKLAARSGGTVAAALAARPGTPEQETKALVLRTLRALREQNEAALLLSARDWSDGATELLTAWCHEAISGRWRLFSAAEAALIDRRLPIRILAALRPDTTPRYLVNPGLVGVLRRGLA